MKIRRFYGKDMREALNKVKAELGANAVIMSNKRTSDGVEIVAAYDQEPVKAPAQANSSPQAPKPGRDNKPTPTLSEIIGDTGPDSLRALLDKQAEQQGNNQGQAPIKPAPQAGPVHSTIDKPQVARFSSASEPQVTATQSGAPSAAAGVSGGALDEMKEELQALRDVLQFQVAGLVQQQQAASHPMHNYLVHRLEAMGIDSSLAEDLVGYTPKDVNERDAWLYLLKLLANRLSCTSNDILRQGGVVALVGPTGTGKTTTIAKLAAQYAQRHGADKVALITTDSYRIAAYEQLATYGKIIGCPVKQASNQDELEQLLLQYRNKGLVLIDTAGFGQRDARLIKQLDTLSQTNCANIKHYLVLQANAQIGVMDRILKAYGKIPLQGCIFTKLDECYSLGEAISVAVQNRLPVAYLTDGQKVPEDIQAASTKTLITMAAKLYKQYAMSSMNRQPVPHSALAV